MTLQIEKAHPIPAQVRRGTAKIVRAALARMKPGDSFTVVDSAERTSAHMAALRLGAQVRTRKMDGGGYRVWLVNSMRKAVKG